MTKKDEVIIRRLYFKKYAKRIMGERGNLLRFIGASLILLAISDAFAFLFEGICYFLIPEMPSSLFAAELFLLFLVLAPLMAALARMAYRMCARETTELSDILYYFNRERLRGVYILSLFVLCELLVQFALSFAFGRLVAYAFEGIHAEFFSPFALALALLFMPLLSGAFPKVLTAPNAFFKTENIKEAFSASSGNARGQAREITLFNISFLPLVFLSVLTLGILFFVYLLPLYMISAQLLASYYADLKK